MTAPTKPKPPLCPPDPWPMIGKAWHEMQAFREMLWQVLLDMSMTDPRFAALLQNFIINALVTDPRIYKILQDMVSQGISNAITSDTTVINELKTLINQLIADSKMGVIDGSDAQPGQIGEYVLMHHDAPIPTTALVQTPTIGVLQPGDWQCWASANSDAVVTGVEISLLPNNPTPVGFDNPMWAQAYVGALAEVVTLVTPTSRALLTVPTTITFNISTNWETAGTLAGSLYLDFMARRMR